MQKYEYHVVPAPKRGKKAKGVKGGEARFAHALSEVMNDMAADGWEYLRTDTLPSEERSGLTSRATVFQNMLVFRRAVDADISAQDDAAPVDIAAVSEAHAPKLPSADDAQSLPDDLSVPLDSSDAQESRAAE